MSELTVGKIEHLGNAYHPSKPVLPSPDVDSLRYRRLRSAAPLTESEDWLGFIRQQPCIVCGVEGTKDWPMTAHHTTAGHHGGARADFSAIPLCPRCHEMAEQSRELHTDCALVYLPLFFMRLMASVYTLDGLTLGEE